MKDIKCETEEKEMENISAENNHWTNESNLTVSTEGDIPLPVIPRWGFWINFFTTPAIVLVGIVGNVLSFLVMKTKPLRRKSYSHYLCSLAVFDTLTLIIRQVENVDEYLVSYKKTRGLFHYFNDGGCKLFNFIVHVITLMSSWILVLMAIERVIAVRFPFKKFYFRKETGAAVALILLFVIACVTQSYRIFMVRHMIYDNRNNITDCLAADEYLELYTSLDVFFFLWTLVFALPVLVIIICNSIVLFHMFKVRNNLSKQEDYLTYRNGRARERRQKSTAMLLIVTFVYILTLLPLFTLSLIVDVTIKVGTLETARSTYVILKPYVDLSISISLLNYSGNFFIYVLSGKRFRYELQKLFTKNISVKRSSTVRSTREELLRYGC